MGQGTLQRGKGAVHTPQAPVQKGLQGGSQCEGALGRAASPPHQSAVEGASPGAAGSEAGTDAPPGSPPPRPAKE
eukprot:5188135-Pyramimonas_sp.AAC.1